MSFWARIRSLHIAENKYFRILLLAELLFLFAAALGLFGKDAVYEYGAESMISSTGVWVESYEGIYLEGQENGETVEIQNISLPKGTYRVQLKYATDTNMVNSCSVIDSSIPAKNLRTNGTGLFAGLTQTDFDMWLLQDSAHLTVQVQYGGEGMLAVQGLTIYQTNAWNRIGLFVLFCFITLFNVCWVYVCYDKAYRVPTEKKSRAFLLGVIVLFSSLPLMVDGMPGAGDLIYHLMRVEGIKDGLLSGQFPIRISPNWIQGYGYASPIFYGETLLYPAALFRLIGFSIVTSYRLYLLLVTVATVLIAYFCFGKMFQNPNIGVFCSMLYSLSVYRIYKTYLCGSWGETLGIMALPLLVYGFYRVFSREEEEGCQKSWIPLTAGFTLLIQSHLLTGEMAGFFTILLCILFWKRVFRKKTFFVLAKTVVYSALLSAWFLVPFMDYMLTGDFVIQHVSERTIQDRGLYLAHLLFTFFRGGSTVYFADSGMADTQPMGVGISLIAALLVFGLLLLNKRGNVLSDKELALGKVAAGFSLLAMLFSLRLFPWDDIQKLGSIPAVLVSSIQFPNRFLTVANVCLVTVAGVVAKWQLLNKRRIQLSLYIGGMVFLLGISSIFLLNDILSRVDVFRAYNSEGGLGTGYIAGAEYLPYGADASRYWYHEPECPENVTCLEYQRKELGAEAWLSNEQEEPAQVTFSLLYYKGYHAYAAETREEIPCYAGDNFQVTVELPAGFEGEVTVSFESPWYWRLGEIISLVTLLSMGISGLYGKKKKREEVPQCLEG